MRKDRKHRNTIIGADESFDGRRYHSKAEMRRSKDLQLLERSGHIRWLEFQPRFVLKVNGKTVTTYIADFKYTEGDKEIVEDVKGHATLHFKIKWKLVQALYPNYEYRLSGAKCKRQSVR